MLIQTVYDFIESPLVSWAKSILDIVSNTSLEYDLFPNGEYFYQMLKRIDPRLESLQLPNEGEPYDTTRSRLLNLDYVIRNIKSFYQEMLNHILLIKMPDIYQIAKYPQSEETFKEMEKILLLLLGLAINGDNKATFINQIQQTLNEQTQSELVDYIKLVNDDLAFSISKSLLIELNTPATSSSSSNDHDESCSAISMTIVSSAFSSSTSFTSNQCMCSPIPTTTPMSMSMLNTNNAKPQQQQANSTPRLKVNSVDELNYFINAKLLPNLKRVVDERDLYLESIIELEQDKEQLNARLSQLSGGCGCGNGTTSAASQVIGGSGGSGELVNGGGSGCGVSISASSSSSGCSSSNSNSDQFVNSEIILGKMPSSSLIDLSDTQTIYMLIESIYKEISATNNSIKESIESSTVNGAMNNGNNSPSHHHHHHLLNHHHNSLHNGASLNHDPHKKQHVQQHQHQESEQRNDFESLLSARTSESLLDELKNRKLLTNNWNQKLAIELVECKIKLRQLIMEM